jgi:hypothetical protein
MKILPRPKFTLLIILVVFSRCDKDVIVVKDPTQQVPVSKPETKSISNARINAWEAPFNLHASDSPSDVVSKLQNAIQYATTNNKELIIEKGTYTINGQITFPSGTYVDFSGSEFKRESGTGAGDIFTMFTNADHINGNNSITIKNLVINGNRVVDGLSSAFFSQRFSGLHLSAVSNSKLYKITVTETVNEEVTAGGIFFTDNCYNIDAYELTAYNNDRTGIIIEGCSNIRIYGSLTFNNMGSGISTGSALRCEYHNIVSYHNGFYPEHTWGEIDPPNGSQYRYSNVSINGLYSKINGVLTYDCTGSGLVIGHMTPGHSGDYSIVDNVESFGCELDGITVSNSKHVLMSNLHVYDNLRNNVQIYENSSAVQILNANIHGYNSVNGVARGGQGIIIVGGSNYNLNNINTYDNMFQGIFISGADGVSIGSEVNAYNNGRVNDYLPLSSQDIWTAGIEAQNASRIYINGSKAFSNQTSNITQNYGIILSNINTAKVIYAQCYGNGIQNTVKELGYNTGIQIID